MSGPIKRRIRNLLLYLGISCMVTCNLHCWAMLHDYYACGVPLTVRRKEFCITLAVIGNIPTVFFLAILVAWLGRLIARAIVWVSAAAAGLRSGTTQGRE